MSEPGALFAFGFWKRAAQFVTRLIPEMPDDPGAAKSLALLGPNGFGPLCATCGRRDWRGMHPRHYAYVNRLSLREQGKPFCKLAGVCQCAPEAT